MPPRPRVRPPKVAASPPTPKLTPTPTRKRTSTPLPSPSHPPSFSLPSSLTCPRLRDIAFHAGAQIGASRKAELKAVLEDAIQASSSSLSTQKDSKTENVLISIDMGIRNFAICVLATGKPTPPKVQKTHRENVTAMTRPLWATTPRVLAWRKYDLLELWARGSCDSTSHTTPEGIIMENEPELSDETDEDPQPALKDINTADIPALAVRVVREIILPLVSLGSRVGAVDRVAIEHQRHRSGSSKGVLQTTIMVNSLEVSIDTLLHGLRSFAIPASASIYTAMTEAAADVPATQLMDPRKVTDFWVREAERAMTASQTHRLKSTMLRKSRTPVLLAGHDSITLEDLASDDADGEDSAADASKKTLSSKMKLTLRAVKKAKIAVLKTWLQAGVIDLATPEAQAVGRAFLPDEEPAKKTTKKSTKKKAATDKDAKKTKKSDPAAAARARKMDDLADCLLQGLYVLRINENRRAMYKWSVDAFLQTKKE